MSRVFLDTSGLIAVINTDDHWHARAEIVWHQLVASANLLLTSSLVLIELADGLSRVHHRGLAIRLVESLQASQRVEIVRVDERLEQLGWQLFRDRADKEWGMTDCVSLAIMGDRQIYDAFTADHHFEQAGFNVLLK